MTGSDAQAHGELASFGDELRREREIRGISLKEIADATKVSKRFLEALEKNDHHTLPAPVFTRGFVREYARYLGLNADEIVNRYNFAAAGDDRIEKSAHLERLAQATIDRDPTQPRSPRAKRDIPPAYSRVDRNVFGLFLAIAALGAIITWTVMHKRQLQTVQAEPQSVSAPSTAVSSAAPQIAAALPEPPASRAAAQGEELNLLLTVSRDSWIALEIDGEPVLSEELRAGDQRTFQAREEFRFKTIGNAGGVALTLNGVAMPSLGSEGAVLHDHVLTRESLRTASTATARPSP